MALNRLNDKDRSILETIQFHADATLREISRSTGLKEHTVSYHLKLLQADGIIRPTAVIDLYALGLSEFTVYFSLTKTSEKSRVALLKSLRTSDRIAWYGELGGDYHYGATFVATDAHDATNYLFQLLKGYSPSLYQKSVSMVIAFALFEKDYLFEKKSKEFILVAPNPRAVDLDALDKNILAICARKGPASPYEISKDLNIPRSTIDFRIKKLEEEKVIVRYLYHIRSWKLGYHIFKLFIFGRGFELKNRESLLRYCFDHPNIVYFASCFGTWDYEVTVEVKDPREIPRIVDSLHDQFGSFVDGIKLVSVFQQGQSENFLGFLETN